MRVGVCIGVPMQKCNVLKYSPENLSCKLEYIDVIEQYIPFFYGGVLKQFRGKRQDPEFNWTSEVVKEEEEEEICAILWVNCWRFSMLMG